MMKRILSATVIHMLLTSVLFISACGTVGSATNMSFSFDTNTPSDSYDEKSIYVKEDMDSVIINGDLTMDSGEITVKVIDTDADESQSEIYNVDFTDSTAFNMNLTDLKKDNEYVVQISAVQSKRVNLNLTCDTALVQDKEKPETH